MVAGKGGKHMDQKKIGQFLQTLRKEKELTQEQLAEKFNVSPETVRRQFRRADTGLTPHKLLSLLRHQLAIELLEQTDLSIAEIAGRCGYADPFSFSRAFKKRDLQSPLQHRKKFR